MTPNRRTIAKCDTQEGEKQGEKPNPAGPFPPLLGEVAAAEPLTEGA